MWSHVIIETVQNARYARTCVSRKQRKAEGKVQQMSAGKLQLTSTDHVPRAEARMQLQRQAQDKGVPSQVLSRTQQETNCQTLPAADQHRIELDPTRRRGKRQKKCRQEGKDKSAPGSKTLDLAAAQQLPAIRYVFYLVCRPWVRWSCIGIVMALVFCACFLSWRASDVAIAK